MANGGIRMCKQLYSAMILYCLYWSQSTGFSSPLATDRYIVRNGKWRYQNVQAALLCDDFVITRLFPKPILVLHGSLLVRKGDAFSSGLLSKSSEEFIAKASKYEHLLNSIFEESDLKHSIAGIKVHGFKHGSLVVNFRLYIDRENSSSISINETAEKATLTLERGLQSRALQRNLQIDVTLLEMSEFYTSSNASYLSTESDLHHYNADLNVTEVPSIAFDKEAVNDTTALVEDKSTTDTTRPMNEIGATIENTPINQNTELKVADSHQNTDRPFALSFGPWVPFIPTGNPIPTDRIITIPHSNSKEPVIPFIDNDDDEEKDLLEERYLKQSSDATNATDVLVKLLSKTQLKPPHSLNSSTYLVPLTSQNGPGNQQKHLNTSTGTKNVSHGNSSLSDVFSGILINHPNSNERQAWIPITPHSVASSTIKTEYENRMENNITRNKMIKNHESAGNLSLEEYETVAGNSSGQSNKTISNIENHDFSDTSLKIPSIDEDNRWRGYYPLRGSDFNYYRELPAGRRGTGEAYAFPINDRYIGESEFIPVTPSSTTELTVGASLYINRNRKPNRPLSSSHLSHGNLRTILPSSLLPDKRNQGAFNVEIDSPLIKRQPLAPQSGFSINTRNDPSASHGSDVASLDVSHSLYIRVSNRSFDAKSIKDQQTPIASSTIWPFPDSHTDRIGFAKIISSNVPNKQHFSSTKDTSSDDKKVPVQNKNQYMAPLIASGNSTRPTETTITVSIGDHLLVNFSSPKPDAFRNQTDVKSQKLVVPEEESKDSSLIAEVCLPQQGFRCGNGYCTPWKDRCNRKFDCDDKSDEMNCSCAEYFWSQRFSRKICDGIIDCWDQTDEIGCPWCSSEKFICPNTKRCIDVNQVCDGIENCPFGSDEQHCVTLAQSIDDVDDHHYRSSGYIAMRKNGRWGMLCSENFYEGAVKRDIERIGQSVCSSLSYSAVDSIRKATNYDPKSATYFQLQHVNSTSRTNHHVQEVECKTKKLMQVTCKSLECGIRSFPATNRSRIVGGQSSVSGSWPWQVALYKEGDFQCGAVLISDQCLITAAHCFFHSKTAYWTARLGLLRRGTELPSPYEEIHAISHIIINPNYEEKGYINDIALLRMDNAVSFSDYIRPVCLPEPHEDIQLWHNQLCTVVGWGKLFETGRLFPDTLQEVWLPVFDTEECRKRTIFLPLYKVTNEMFCAGYERGGRDACLGDSGGPLVCQRPNGKWTVVGVTSNGDGCGRPGRPGVYTKVTSFLNWMKPVLESVPDPLNVAACNGHRCQLGRCIAQRRVCDGVMDCWNGSDELNCSIRR